MKTLPCIYLFAAFVLLPVSVLSCSAFDDTTPPELVEFSLDPTEVDVSTGSADVMVTARVTDDLSGVALVYFHFESPSNNSLTVILSLESGTPNDGVYTGTATFAQYTEEGIWLVDDMYLLDAASNVALLETSVIQGMGFPIEVQVISPVVDTTSPELIELSLDPTEVDVTTGPAEVIVTARITDDLSGMGFGFFSFDGPSGQSFAVLMALESGTPNDGVYTGIATFEQYTEEGTWQIDGMYLSDEVGNTTLLETAALQGMGFPTDVQVTSAVSDTIPPELVEFSLDPTEVDVTTGPAEVTVTARVTDDLSGVGSMYFTFDGPSGQSIFVLMAFESGTVNDGVYQGTAIFGQQVEEGTWQVNNMYLYDKSGNTTFLETDNINTMGFPTDVSVTSSTATEHTSWGRLKILQENEEKQQ